MNAIHNLEKKNVILQELWSSAPHKKESISLSGRLFIQDKRK